MKKIIYLFILILILPACTRSIILRKNQSLTAPYNEKTLPKGSYEITLYRIDYPSKLEEKQKFFNELNVLLKKYYLKDKKVSFLISEAFFYDLKSLESSALLQEEKVYDKAASLLSSEEIKFLLENSGQRIKKFEGTTQEYLNIQIKYLMGFLGKPESYDENRLYSEREKSELVDEIRETRKENVELLNSIGIEFILELDKPYEDKKNNIYWDNREVVLKNSSRFSSTLNNYNVPIYIKGIINEDVTALIKDEYKINNKAVLVQNDLYEGYKNLGQSYLFLVGGIKKIKSYEDYDFNIKIIDIKLEDMVNLKSSMTLTEILGGKK